MWYSKSKFLLLLPSMIPRDSSSSNFPDDKWETCYWFYAKKSSHRKQRIFVEWIRVIIFSRFKIARERFHFRSVNFLHRTFSFPSITRPCCVTVQKRHDIISLLRWWGREADVCQKKHYRFDLSQGKVFT